MHFDTTCNECVLNDGGGIPIIENTVRATHYIITVYYITTNINLIYVNNFSQHLVPMALRD